MTSQKQFVKILVACALCVSSVLAIGKQQEREMLRQILIECKGTENGSSEDFEKLFNHEFPETKEGNCMMACAYEFVGVVS